MAIAAGTVIGDTRFGNSQTSILGMVSPNRIALDAYADGMHQLGRLDLCR